MSQQKEEISTLTVQQRNAERLKRLRDLHTKRNEARQMNFQAALEEEKNKKMPANWEAKKQRAEWILNDDEQRKIAQEKGEDYDRIKRLQVTALDAETSRRKKMKKHNPDQGFADYEQATARQYGRLVQQMKPDMDDYHKQKEKLGGAFYGDRYTIFHGLRTDTKEGIDRMVEDLEKQIAKREKYSRRRAHNDDADIDYINERNMKFNQKLERFYGEHTLEIKQNLERGTAV